jgi:hypothetical protein
MLPLEISVMVFFNLEIKKIAEERLLLSWVMRLFMMVAIAIMIFLVIRFVVIPAGVMISSALHNFFQFTFIQPYAAAVRTVIYFYAMLLTH